MQNKAIIAKNIKTLRSLKGLTQQTLADRIHKKRNWIAKVEAGELRIYGDDLITLARALGVRAERLMKPV